MTGEHTPNSHIPRRTALGAIAGAAAVAAGTGSAFGAASGAHTVVAPEMLGWDAEAGEYKLPDLPYPADALEPFIDAQTMTIHHDKHHAGYVRGLNKAIGELKKIRESGDTGLIQHWERQLSFHGGGHVNHTLFWTGMAPRGRGGGGEPAGALREAVSRDFGSPESMLTHFKAAAGAVEGSGWGWLVYEPVAKQLLILQMQNQQQMMFPGCVPLLGVDVWEHAYYLKYQNNRGAYLDAFTNVINWAEVGRRFNRATA